MKYLMSFISRTQFRCATQNKNSDEKGNNTTSKKDKKNE